MSIFPPEYLRALEQQRLREARQSRMLHELAPSPSLLARVGLAVRRVCRRLIGRRAGTGEPLVATDPMLTSSAMVEDATGDGVPVARVPQLDGSRR